MDVGKNDGKGRAAQNLWSNKNKTYPASLKNNLKSRFKL